MVRLYTVKPKTKRYRKVVFTSFKNILVSWIEAFRP